MILHATRQWPDAITPHKWPYALKMANKIRNITPRSQDGLVPIALFAWTNQMQQLDHLHPFRCPVFIHGHKITTNEKDR